MLTDPIDERPSGKSVGMTVLKAASAHVAIGLCIPVRRQKVNKEHQCASDTPRFKTNSPTGKRYAY